MKTQFVSRSLALKGGKSKADYISACKEKGLKPVYSGKTVYDKEGNMVRESGFFVTLV